MKLISGISTIAVLLLAAALTAAQTKPSDKELRVLFVGNSLTYSNQLPEIVAALARASKQKKLSYTAVARPNFSLEDHWNEDEVHKLLKNKKWDYVVMQQGPSASDDGRKVLIEYSRKFAEEIIRAGAKPALFGVWGPRSYRPQMFERVLETYELAANEIRGIYIPVGRAWLLALERERRLELYSSDGFHPSTHGSYLAALAIFQKLYGQTPIGLKSRFPIGIDTWIDIPDKQAKILQQAAADANAQSSVGDGQEK